MVPWTGCVFDAVSSWNLRGSAASFSKQDQNRARHRDGAHPSGENEYDYELFQVDDAARLQEFIERRALIQEDHYWGLAGIGPQKRPSLIPGLGFVWENAQRALYRADEIIVVGFSFSRYDRLAQIEFARVAAGRAENGASQVDRCAS